MIKPLNDFLVIEQDKVKEISCGGVFIPETVQTYEKNAKTEGTVVFTNQDSRFKVGQKVIFKKWSGDEFKLKGQELLFVKEDDLIALITS